jgi:hypothetical protein
VEGGGTSRTQSDLNEEGGDTTRILARKFGNLIASFRFRAGDLETF